MAKKSKLLLIFFFILMLVASCKKEEETAVATASLPGKVLPRDRLIVQSVFFDRATSKFTVGGQKPKSH